MTSGAMHTSYQHGPMTQMGAIYMQQSPPVHTHGVGLHESGTVTHGQMRVMPSTYQMQYQHIQPQIIFEPEEAPISPKPTKKKSQRSAPPPRSPSAEPGSFLLYVVYSSNYEGGNCTPSIHSPLPDVCLSVYEAKIQKVYACLPKNRHVCDYHAPCES